jgi:ribosome-associated heat shock protein Hsp15
LASVSSTFDRDASRAGLAGPADAEQHAAALRVDRWLWYVRFFRTRTLAAEAVRSGHVRLNAQRAKPAREVKVGDALTIVRGAAEYEVMVTAIPDRRGPASEAMACYSETPQSRERRERQAAQRTAAGTLDAPPTLGRPDKRTRRLMRRSKGRGPSASDD